MHPLVFPKSEENLQFFCALSIRAFAVEHFLPFLVSGSGFFHLPEDRSPFLWCFCRFISFCSVGTWPLWCATQALPFVFCSYSVFLCFSFFSQNFAFAIEGLHLASSLSWACLFASFPSFFFLLSFFFLSELRLCYWRLTFGFPAWRSGSSRARFPSLCSSMCSSLFLFFASVPHFPSFLPMLYDNVVMRTMMMNDPDESQATGLSAWTRSEINEDDEKKGLFRQAFPYQILWKMAVPALYFYSRVVRLCLFPPYSSSLPACQGTLTFIRASFNSIHSCFSLPFRLPRASWT